MTELTERQREILALERLWWSKPGAKDVEIRKRFDVSPVLYYAELNALLDTEAALAFDPVTVRRLQRLRDRARGRR